jgi:hypothetical protein
LNSKKQEGKMRNIKYILLLCFLVTQICSQKNITIHAGIKPIEYKGSSIQLYYRDESPDPDDFYTDINLNTKLIYNLGVNFNNYSKSSKIYYDLTANGYLGNYLGLEIGASVGYPLFLNKSKKLSILPSIMGGGGWYDKNLGTLQNNTVYIEVNDTKFKDNTNVDLSLSGFYGFVRPSITFIISLNNKVQLRMSGSYLLNFDINPSVKFSGEDESGNQVTAKEDITATNLAFYIDNKRTNDSPFKLMGPEVRFGVNFLLGNQGKSVK